MIAVGLGWLLAEEPHFTDFGSETIGGDRYNLSNHGEFCSQVHKLVQAPHSSSDRASEQASQRSVMPCLGGAPTCSAVLSSPQRPHRSCKGTIDMALIRCLAVPGSVKN